MLSAGPLFQFFVVTGKPKNYVIHEGYATFDEAFGRCPPGGFVVEVRSNPGRPAGAGRA